MLGLPPESFPAAGNGKMKSATAATPKKSRKKATKKATKKKPE